MTKRTGLFFVLVLSVGTLVSGCGTSGTRAPQFPEVRFQVRPTGQSTFTAQVGATNRVPRTFPAGTTFTATSLFNFFLENAAPPYAGSFTVESGGDIEVTLSVTGQADVTASASAGGPAAVVQSGALTPGTASAPTVEARFDVCVPSTSASSCLFSESNPGIFGLLLNGAVGDAFTTHLVNATTPSIFFLEGARDSVEGVFTLFPFSGQTLIVQLYVDGQLKQTESVTRGSGTEDVIVKEQL